MSFVVEFVLPADSVALDRTLSDLQDVSVEIERNVWDATTDLTPYVWVTGTSVDQFELTAEDDPSVVDVELIARFDSTGLFRLCIQHPETGFLDAVGSVDAVLQSASANGSAWTFTVRFDGRDALDQFQTRCSDDGISYEVLRLSELSDGGRQQYGLTPKQHEALSVAHRMGYFREPREATLEEISDSLGISRQALSRRLRRGQEQFFADVFTDESTLIEG